MIIMTVIDEEKKQYQHTKQNSLPLSNLFKNNHDNDNSHQQYIYKNNEL